MFHADQKRLLALDGGGILGLISLQILKTLEDQLRPHAPDPDSFVLRDYFDYFAGTSTGAIITTGLALGWPVQRLIDFYLEYGPEMFERVWFWRRVFHRYDATKLTNRLKKEIGGSSILDLQNEGVLSRSKHLMIVTQNISSDSPWPLSTNPNSIYNDVSRPDCNLKVPLWKIVRASTAAPTYFPPQEITEIPKKDGTQQTLYFEDGGITPYNNPAFLLYRMATLPQYCCEWADGEDKMMLVSIGTGCVSAPEPDFVSRGRHLIKNARSIAPSLMQRISIENDIKCRTIGRCVFGHHIDNEIRDMVLPISEPPDNLGRKFLYARYDPALSDEGMAELGLHDLKGRKFEMDDLGQMEALIHIGETYARRNVTLNEHFPTFLPSGPPKQEYETRKTSSI